jgi:hypothetical protein
MIYVFLTKIIGGNGSMLTNFEVELSNGSLVRMNLIMCPDQHTSAHVREMLSAAIRERFGARDPEIKSFCYEEVEG